MGENQRVGKKMKPFYVTVSKINGVNVLSARELKNLAEECAYVGCEYLKEYDVLEVEFDSEANADFFCNALNDTADMRFTRSGKLKAKMRKKKN